jgi:hypothetical protein
MTRKVVAIIGSLFVSARSFLAVGPLVPAEIRTLGADLAKRASQLLFCVCGIEIADRRA